jgi:hypothetical protein
LFHPLTPQKKINKDCFTNYPKAVTPNAVAALDFLFCLEYNYHVLLWDIAKTNFVLT